jgi:hypothetical protein
MPQHYSKQIGRPFRKVIESEPSRGRKRLLYLECGHIAERYMHLAVPTKVRCLSCPPLRN